MKVSNAQEHILRWLSVGWEAQPGNKDNVMVNDKHVCKISDMNDLEGANLVHLNEHGCWRATEIGKKLAMQWRNNVHLQILPAPIYLNLSDDFYKTALDQLKQGTLYCWFGKRLKANVEVPATSHGLSFLWANKPDGTVLLKMVPINEQTIHWQKFSHLKAKSQKLGIPLNATVDNFNEHAKEIEKLNEITIGSHLNWGDFNEYISSPLKKVHWGHLNDSEKLCLSVTSPSWKLCVVDVETLKPIENVTGLMGGKAIIIGADGQLVEGRRRLATARNNGNAAIAAWVPSNELVCGKNMTENDVVAYENQRQLIKKNLSNCLVR